MAPWITELGWPKYALYFVKCQQSFSGCLQVAYLWAGKDCRERADIKALE